MGYINRLPHRKSCPKCKGLLYLSNLEGRKKLVCRKCNIVYPQNAEEERESSVFNS
ncbi:hypothetical protein LCGC14_0374820 [marine sediment metagenome]|uniref:Uncharacterized protein n=1 Tax=marine sediment metagenome TaxID=412755 RepID=A0A0F9TMD2_9ZZZZ